MINEPIAVINIVSSLDNVEVMRDSYDVVVIGSGYGGGVAASQRWPGEFREQLLGTSEEVRVSGEFAPGDRSIPGKAVDDGNPTGLYHFVVGEGQNAYMGNGLGGTSLLNANVFLEAHPDVLDMEVWPKELRGKDAWTKYHYSSAHKANPADYKGASSVLEPVEYPATFPELQKANLLQKQAELMGMGDKFYRVKQTTRFKDEPNSTGPCEARYVTKAPGRDGYIIYFAWHGGKRGRFTTLYDNLMWVHAKKCVFFGAVSIGTTKILLRSKHEQFGLKMSEDVDEWELMKSLHIYNTDYEANCIAHPDPTWDRPVGPCSTSVLDLCEQKNVLEGTVVEDCAIHVPSALAPLMSPMLESLLDPVKPLDATVLLKPSPRLSLGWQANFWGPTSPRVASREQRHISSCRMTVSGFRKSRGDAISILMPRR
ncbi:uncharacterized protein F5Z01DRAFT_638618 [Emericellopsis atlantica]|uniref:Glucose-methanol-choline oxidoreductase N-terminal domain-containing protein n=1 Tax=Emericellopsis atlantica TaxID=2614577 RepID=A0A9P7ZIG7_9HYPO|nr:uncharacterized protein F5Z01DRAFT_638618 [Emericellopsis atlantica]KAG9252351.1 hypothetical protein F5Z01DRAFT_638618 [Emericellopsis atlantica]